MLDMPAIPTVPEEQTGTISVSVRYDDICQDGRVALSALPHAGGLLVWGTLLRRHPALRALRDQGILAILSRAIVQGGDGVIAVGTPLTARGGFQLAHTRDDRGEVERLMLNLWAEMSAPKGRSFGPQPADQGTIAHVGTIFAEHVYTRPFAPRDQRKIRAFDQPGLPAVPADVYTWRPPEATLEVPAGARVLEEELVPDDAPVVFGLGQTDSNQHVNSLVYPRLFEEAALRRFARLGVNTALLVRHAEIAYRKPCFAGQRMRIVLQAFEHDGCPGAIGYFISEAALVPETALAPEPPAARPACFIQMLFSP